MFLVSKLLPQNKLFSLLICNLISENQVLEKPRSISKSRKISGSANLDFFSGSAIDLDFSRP